jgi:hypothetical protein
MDFQQQPDTSFTQLLPVTNGQGNNIFKHISRGNIFFVEMFDEFDEDTIRNGV